MNCSEIGHVTKYEMRETSYGSANNGGADQRHARKQATRELTRGSEFDKQDDFNAKVMNNCYVFTQYIAHTYVLVIVICLLGIYLSH